MATFGALKFGFGDLLLLKIFMATLGLVYMVVSKLSILAYF